MTLERAEPALFVHFAQGHLHLLSAEGLERVMRALPPESAAEA